MTKVLARPHATIIGGLAAWLLGAALGQAAEITLVDAAEAGDGATALQLLSDGSDANAQGPAGTTPVMWAAYHGDLELIRALIDAGADVTLMNEFGTSALAEAAVIGSAPIVGALLDAGADPNARNPEGETALMVVARNGAVDAAEVLLDAGADINATEAWGGQSALMWAAARSQADMVRFLAERGADLDARGVIRQWDRKTITEPRPKDMNKGGFTPLLYAAREGCVECARRLVEAGADIDLHDPDRTTPLVLAIMNMRFDTAAYLIEAGADVDKWDLYGQSPVYAAVDLATLPRGGRPDIPSTDTTSAMDVLAMLLERGANPNLQLKLRPPYRNVIFDRGGDSLLSTGATPLLRASKAGDNPEAIRMLLEHGALVDLPTANGTTPLMAAAGMGHGNNPTRGRFNTEDDALAAVPLLLAGGADVDARADNGRTAVHAAVEKGWGRVVRLLADNGADLNVADNGGRTPMDLAAGNRGGRGGPAPPDEAMVSLLEELAR